MLWKSNSPREGFKRKAEHCHWRWIFESGIEKYDQVFQTPQWEWLCWGNYKSTGILPHKERSTKEKTSKLQLKLLFLVGGGGSQGPIPANGSTLSERPSFCCSFYSPRANNAIQGTSSSPPTPSRPSLSHTPAIRRLLPAVMEETPGSRIREDTPESELSVAEAEFQVSFQNITKSWSMQLRATHTSYSFFFNWQFQVSGSVVDLHLGTQPMDLVVFNVKRVHNIPVSTWWWRHWW